MDVVIAGGHGTVGMRLGRMLSRHGDRVRGLIRRVEQADDLRAIGVEPVVCDLEAGCDTAAAIAGAQAKKMPNKTPPRRIPRFISFPLQIVILEP